VQRVRSIAPLRSLVPWSATAVLVLVGLRAGRLTGESSEAESEFDREIRVAYTVNNFGYTETCG